MPVQRVLTFKQGSTSKIAIVHLVDPALPSRGVTGLRHDTSGAGAAFVRAGEAHARRIALAPGVLGVFAPGGFVEADAARLPGVYQLGLPDEALAAGAARALVMLRFPGAACEPLDIDLVAYDPDDFDTVGIGELGNKLRHRFLRAAMRGLTEEDYEVGEELAQTLTARIGERRAP